MAPTQVTLLPMNDDLVPFAQGICETFGEAGLRVNVDDRAESLNKKIRDAQLGNVPLILTIGNKEKETGTLSVRTLDGNVCYGITRERFLSEVMACVAARKIELDLFRA